MRNAPGAPVRQRNYFEHIIRENTDYNQIAEYIASSPRRWKSEKDPAELIFSAAFQK